MSLHNKLCDGVVDLTSKALTPTHICNDPLINRGSAMWSGRASFVGYHPPNNPQGMAEDSKQKFGLLIQDIWDKGNDCIFDMRMVNTDAVSCVLKTSEKILIAAERDKNTSTCMLAFRNTDISPLFVSVGSLLGTEAEATLKRLSRFLSNKLQQPYYRTCHYFCSRASITMVWVTYRCIWVSQVPESRISVQWPHWKDSSRLNLYRSAPTWHNPPPPPPSQKNRW